MSDLELKADDFEILVKESSAINRILSFHVAGKRKLTSNDRQSVVGGLRSESRVFRSAHCRYLKSRQALESVTEERANARGAVNGSGMELIGTMGNTHSCMIVELG